LTLLN